jgi:hypothetical protein
MHMTAITGYEPGSLSQFFLNSGHVVKVRRAGAIVEDLQKMKMSEMVSKFGGD